MSSNSFLSDYKCSFKEDFCSFSVFSTNTTEFSKENIEIYLNCLNKKTELKVKNEENDRISERTNNQDKNINMEVKIAEEETKVTKQVFSYPLYHTEELKPENSESRRKIKVKKRHTSKRKQKSEEKQIPLAKEEPKNEYSSDNEYNENDKSNKQNESEVNEKTENVEQQKTNSPAKVVTNITSSDVFKPSIKEEEEPEVITKLSKDSPIKSVKIYNIGEHHPTVKTPPKHISVDESTISSYIPANTTSLYTVVLWPSKQKLEKFIYLDQETNKEVMFATRNRKIGSLSYTVYLSSNPSSPIATITSNMARTQFTATKGDEKICFVDYKSDLLSKTPNRHFAVTVPKPPKEILDEEGIMCDDESPNIIFVTKKPQMKGNIPVLRFGGRVKLQSIKNFILVPYGDNDMNLLIFGKKSDNEFVADILSPLTPLQSFAIALAQF